MKWFLRAVCAPVVLCAAFIAQSLFAQQKSPPPQKYPPPDAIAETASLSDSEKRRRAETFNFVWQTVRENHFDQTFGGQDWEKIREEFSRRISQAGSDQELHEQLQEMLNRLGKSHLAIIPPEFFRAVELAKVAGRDGGLSADKIESDRKTEPALERRIPQGIGAEIRLLANRIVITRVETDSPAAKAGLKPGYLIEKINGVNWRTFLESFRRDGGGVYAKVYEKQLSGLLASLIYDDAGNKKTVTVDFVDETGRPKNVQIKLAPKPGDLVKILPELPPQFLSFQTKSLNEEIGYVKFNVFALKTVENFCASVGQFKNKRALVIDLRGNAGGNFGAMFGILSLLAEREMLVGTQIGKAGREPNFVRPQAKRFKGKIVVVTDVESHSAAEIFAAALKENGRATIVGETTAGSALPALSRVLPTGAVFLYPIADFSSPKGNFIEDKGVEPNIKIPLEPQSLLQGKDNQLEAALDFLNEELKRNLPENERDEANKNNTSPARASIIFGSIKFGEPAIKPVTFQDQKALEIIDDYIAAVGGRENLEKLNSLVAKGRAELKQSGTVVVGALEIFRQLPNKIAKVTKIETLGEIREVFDGRESFVQTDFMGLEKRGMETAEKNLAFDLRELLDARINYPNLVLEAAFEKNGRKINLVKAASARGSVVYFAFDAESKLLISRAGTGMTAAYGDYRRVGQWMFPFEIAEASMTFKLTEITPNAPIENATFAPKADCFSKID